MATQSQSAPLQMPTSTSFANGISKKITNGVGTNQVQVVNEEKNFTCVLRGSESLF